MIVCYVVSTAVEEKDCIRLQHELAMSPRVKKPGAGRFKTSSIGPGSETLADRVQSPIDMTCPIAVIYAASGNLRKFARGVYHDSIYITS